jgi:hypothetical protein
VNHAVKIIVGIVILGALGFWGYKNFLDWKTESLEKAVRKEQQRWQEKTARLENEVGRLQQELETLKSATVPKEKAAAALGREPDKVYQKERTVSFAEIEREIASFFRYLDNQSYIASYGLKGGTYREFQKAVEELAKNPPIITGEMDSLHRLLKNMAHLFRVSGKRRIKLANDILSNESDIIEPVMRLFYLWFTLKDSSRPNTERRPSLQALYEYSGYFLTTLAGRSYLLRRDSRVRTLTYYYCVLILDRANDEKLNSYGLDIRPYLQKSYDEISHQRGLVNHQTYMATLDDLKQKYKVSENQ